jgi:hypothetical protein
MFPTDSLACSFVSGFFPIFPDAQNCTWEFVVSMAMGCVAAFVFRLKRTVWLSSLFGGVAAYYACFGAIAIVMQAITPSSTNQEQLGWFLFLCIFLAPRALLASAIGISCWEAFCFVKTTLRANKNHG